MSTSLTDAVENLSDLDELTLEQLSIPFEMSEGMITVPLISQGEDGVQQTLWLNVKQRRTCAYVKSKYDYEAFTSTDPGGANRIAVDWMELKIRRVADNANYTHTCRGASWCPKTDRIYATGNTCGRSFVSACAQIGGYNKWCTKTVTVG